MADGFDDFELGDDAVQGTPIGEAFEEPELMDQPEVVVNNTTAPVPAQATTPAPVSADPPALPAEFDFNTINLGITLPGVIVAETGTKVSRFPIERIKFTTSKKERISIILDNVIIVKTHYIEDTGSIICYGGKCCELCDLPAVRYVFPVVHYENTDKKGTPLSTDLDVKLLSVGKDNYEELLTIMDNKGPLSQFDIVVTCNDEGYQKCSFTEAGPARWKKSKKAQATVAERLQKDGPKMLACLGRTVNDEQLLKLLGEDSAPGLDPNVNMDDIFKDS